MTYGDPPDYRLDPPEEPLPPCPCGWGPACDCEPEFDPPDSEPRPRNHLELEDATLLPMATCSMCGRSLTTTETDWPGDGDVCTECAEMLSDAAGECPETRRTGA
jgi:hypothetical protein